MKKLLVLVFALIAVIGMIFAIYAADAQKLSGLGDVSKLYKADGSEIVGGGMNGGSYMQYLFDGGYGANYNNNVGSYIITDLNAKLAGGYYVTEIKIYHSNNSKFSLYYTSDGKTWKEIVKNAQTAEATYAVGDTAVQVKYVFETCVNWVASAKEIEIYGIDPAELECLHGNLASDGWTPVPGSATCTEVGKVSQACPDCGEVLEQVSNDVLPLGHDLVSTVTKPGTSISYGSATLNCSRCDYEIDFQGEMNLTSSEYCSIGASTKFSNVSVSSIADLWGASTVENMFKGDWEAIGAFSTWIAAGEVDEDEYVIIDFKGAIDLTKVRVLVQNDSQGTLKISAFNKETGEYEVVRSLQTYNETQGAGSALLMEVPMLGVTTSSIKIQVFSNWRNTNGYYYNRMVIGELEVMGIAEGCGLDADNHECSYETLVDYIVEPTCQEGGSGTYKCACNATTVLEIEASEEFHNYEEVADTRVNSTCTVAGSYTGKCEYCEAETIINLDVDGETGHNYVETARTAADCENAGSIEYKCELCEGTKTEEIPALGHTYGEAVVVPSTCKENGTSTKTCSVCGDEEVTTLETTGCTWTQGEIITEPTCGAKGEANYVCSVCGDTKVDEVAATGNHTWDEENVEVTLAPTCDTTGAGKFTCTVCGKVESKTIKETGHTWAAATCTEPEKCTVCNNTKFNSKPLGHTLSEATCTEAPVCSVCGAVEGEPAGHKLATEGVVVAPSCEAQGYTAYACENCDYVEKSDYTDALGGTCLWLFVAYDENDMPLCGVKGGTAMYTCVVCNATKSEVQEEPHDFTYFTENVVEGMAPTCTEYGYVWVECQGCSESVQRLAEPRHFFTVSVEYVQSTCTEDGYQTLKCENCDETSTEVFPANGHADWNGVKEQVDATCTQNGYKIFDCSECGAVDVRVEIEANPEEYHYAMDWFTYEYLNLVIDEETYAELTCQQAGYIKYECPHCDFEIVEEYEFVEGENHVWDDGVEIEGGYHYECTLCDAVKDDVTAGTFDDPIASVNGENTLVYYATGYNYVVYSVTATAGGTITVNVAETAGVVICNGMWAFDGEFETGATTYTYEVSYAGEFYIVIALGGDYTTPETFSVSFAETVYPTLNYGENTVTTESVGVPVEYVMNVPGRYEITFDESALVSIVYGPYYSETIESGYVLEVGESDSYKLAIQRADFEIGSVTVTVTSPDNSIFDGAYTDDSQSAIYTFENGKLTIEVRNPMMTPPYLAGTYNYNYNSVTNEFILDTDLFTVNYFTTPYGGTLVINNMVGLVAYVPPVELEIGAENAIEVTDTWNGTKVGVSVPGTYYFNYVGETAPFVMVELEPGYAVRIEEYPYEFTVYEGQTIVFVMLESATVVVNEKPAHVHEYSASVTAPTCTEEGYTTYTCEECGASYVDNKVPATGHSYSESVTAPTCTVDGSKTFTCACGDSYSEKITATGHDTAIEIPMVRPTPSKTGYTAGAKCSVCGEVSKAPVAINVTTMANTKDPNFRVASANLSLATNISVNYKSVVTSGYSKPYMVFVFMNAEFVVTDYTIDASTGRYEFNFKRTSSHLMAENIEAYVYAETAEGEYSVNSVLEYSIMKYCTNQLTKDNANMKTVVSNLIVYGGAVQRYIQDTNPNVYDIVTIRDGFTLTPSEFPGTDKITNQQAFTGTQDTKNDWKSVALALGSTTKVELKFITEDVANIKVVIKFMGLEFIYTAEDFDYDEKTGRYVVTLDFIKASQFDETITASFLMNDEPIGRTLTYSINTYVARNANGSLADMLRALYLYGWSVTNLL